MENISPILYVKIKLKKVFGLVLYKLVKSGYSVALMIDQRVSEGIKSKFFNEEDLLTYNIFAQLVS